MRSNIARFVSVVGVSCFAASLAHAGGAKVSDIGYEIIHMISTPSLYWIDNNRLLFAGINKAEMQAAIAAKDQHRGTRLRKLYLWDDVKKSVRLYADAQGVCFSRGVIRYQARLDKEGRKVVAREGPFGSEKEIENELPAKDAVHSNFTCKSHARNELVPPAPRFRRVVVLMEGDGYLDLGPSGGPNYSDERRAEPRNLTLYQAKTGKAISLSMSWEEDFSAFEVAYSMYRRAYVLRPRKPEGSTGEKRKRWSKQSPPLAYLLWADGRTEAISFPYLPSEYVAHPQPVRSGWVFGGGNFYKASGLYLFDGKAVSKIDVGLVKEVAATPDGCKAAVAIQNKHLDMGTPTNIKVFELCVEGK